MAPSTDATSFTLPALLGPAAVRADPPSAARGGVRPELRAEFRAMGTDVVLVLVGGSAAHLAELRSRLAELEARWSRFRPDSDVSRLAARAGDGPVAVHPDTADLIERAVYAWRATDGRYDPTVLPAVIAAGYDRTFRELPADAGPADLPYPAPGCAGVVVDRVAHTVALPPRVGLDLGGVGKGRAGDLLVAQALAAGVPGVCVSIGGDVRAAGEPPTAAGWVVAVEDPLRPPARAALVTIADGAVATSTRTRRTWSRGGRTQHHLIDPRTGEPAWTGVAAVTAVAGEAWWAEVAAKAAYLAGPTAAPSVLSHLGVTGLVIDDAGAAVPAPGWDAYLP